MIIKIDFILKNYIYFILMTIICSCSNPLNDKSGENNWDIIQTDIGLPLIADVRGDGNYRAYGIEGAGVRGNLYEYNYLNGEWVRNPIIIDFPYRLSPLIAARCHTDGKFRLYGYCSEGIFEVEYNNDNWSSQIICNLNVGDSPYTINKGDVRSENIESLFIYYMGKLCELNHREGTWTSSTIDVTSFGLQPSGEMAVGKVREESGDCIYMITNQSIIIEYSCVNGTDWQKSIIDTVYYPGQNVVYGIDIHVGIFSEFDAQSLFVTVGSLYRYKYKTSWLKTKVFEYTPTIMEAGIGRNDDVYRLYCCGWFGEIYEISKIGDSYSISDQLKIGGGALLGLSIGPGRGDGIHRIYVEQFLNDHIYELTCKN